MSGKGVKCRTSWTLLDKNIENVERVSLDPETQRELGCVVGADVFLEYPWVYVPHEAVLRICKTPESSLAAFKDKIEAYEGSTLLIGYSSTRLTSNEFVICLTEEARRRVVGRNREIRRKILDEVNEKINKPTGPWRSLGSEEEVDAYFVKNTREYFETEVCLSTKSLGLPRELGDRDSSSVRSGYAEIVNVDGKFDNVERMCIPRSTQTHLESRQSCVQTYPGYPKNAWTQYVYEDTLPEGHRTEDLEEDQERSSARSQETLDEKEEDRETRSSTKTKDERKLEEKDPLEIFLEACYPKMIDVVRYNTVVNLHVNDIESLAQDEDKRFMPISELIYKTRVSFVDLNFTNGKAISAVSWHPTLSDYVVISYVPRHRPKRESANNRPVEDFKLECKALLWSLADPLRPQLQFQDHREICSISFCPYDGNIVIGGCSTGQIVVWDIEDRVDNKDLNARNRRKTIDDHNVPTVRAIVSSEKNDAHRLPIRDIQWIPSSYTIEVDGKLSKSSSDTSRQFATISQDGSLSIWDLRSYADQSIGKTPPDSPEGSEDPPPSNRLHPIYRLRLEMPGESGSVAPLCLCLPSTKAFYDDDAQQQQQRASELSAKEESYMRSLWLGGAQGGPIHCTWRGQVLDAETSAVEKCEFLSFSHVHDGPVTDIHRSPHLQDVLLSIGGHVLAVWKDHYVESPLFWRRLLSRCTACCWCATPGVFIVGTCEGELLVWDIRMNMNEPISVQVVSRVSITGLYLRVQLNEPSVTIGAASLDGFFRILEEPESDGKAVERIDWFEEYIWREVRRKKVFRSWERDFLEKDPDVVAKRAAREEEERRRLREEAREKLQREHEQRLLLEAEMKARKAPKSKDAIWKAKEFERMKKVLLEKKNLEPGKLERQRLPLVLYEEEKKQKSIKVQELMDLREKYFERVVRTEFPKVLAEMRQVGQIETTIKLPKTVDDYVEEYFNVRDRARKILSRRASKDAIGIICMACASPALVGATHWFLFVVVQAFITTLVWCFVYLLSIRENLKIPIHWILSELLNVSVDAVLYMIAFIAQLSVWTAVNHRHTSANIAAGVFGIFNTIAYAAGAYFLYIEWKAGNTQ
ncbi:hypothetical protein KM043_008203 [Ampulex compressa]|nr:hypothetical protein KM043_008203 [Ampulex compressa]